MATHLPVTLRLEGESVLLLGAGDSVAPRLAQLVGAMGRVDVVAPEAAEPVRRLAREGKVRWFRRGYDPSDLVGRRLVFLAEAPLVSARELRRACRAEGALLCVLDEPLLCDFFNVAVVRAGNLTLGVGTGGSAPGLARRLREELERAFDGRFAAFVAAVGRVRARLRHEGSPDRAARLAALLQGLSVRVEVEYPDWFRGAAPPP